MHHFYHFVTLFIYLNECKGDSSLGEIAHLILDFEAIRTSIWVKISTIADIFAVTWCICDVEHRLKTIFGPAEIQSFVKASLHVLGEVSTSLSWLLLHILLDEVYIFGKVSDVEARMILDVSVGDKAHSDSEPCVLILDVVNNLTECLLGALNP